MPTPIAKEAIATGRGSHGARHETPRPFPPRKPISPRVPRAGGTHTFVPRFDPPAVMRAIQELGVTNSILVPAMIGMLVNAPTIGDYNLTSLRGLMYGPGSTEYAHVQAVVATTRVAFDCHEGPLAA